MIGPGNCMWFHRFMLRVSGRVGEWYEKLLKNHAAIHDAFGFLVNQNDICPRTCTVYTQTSRSNHNIGGIVAVLWVS